MPTSTDPTPAQLLKFYQATRQAVLLSSYIAFVELGSDDYLYLYIGRYNSPNSRLLIKINPSGDASYE